MTDRVKGCYVAFDKDLRTDDVECVLDAIRMIRCVAEVTAEDYVTDPDDWMNRQQIRSDVGWTCSTVLHTLLTGGVSFCPKDRRIKTADALEKILVELRK